MSDARDTGLVYYGRRFYSPSQGRFLGRDPIEEQGGLNLYGFCLNNSINRWDFLGMKLVWVPRPGAAEGGDPNDGDWIDDGTLTIDQILYNNALTEVDDTGVVTLDLMAMRPRTIPPSVVYSQSDLNAPFSLAKVYELLSKTAQGQVLVDQLQKIELRSLTGVDGEGRDPVTNAVVETKILSPIGVTLRPGLAPGTAGGVIYINANLTNKEAIETLFHEFQHYNGLSATPTNEAAIRTQQAIFMSNIGMTTIIPNAVTPPPAGSPPGTPPTVNSSAINASIPASYNLVWVMATGGTIHNNTLLQPAPPPPPGPP